MSFRAKIFSLLIFTSVAVVLAWYLRDWWCALMGVLGR